MFNVYIIQPVWEQFMSIVFSGIEQPAVPLKNDVSLIFPMRFIFVKILTLSTENTEWLSKTVWVPRIFVRERDVFKLLHKFTNKWCIVGYDTEDVRFSNFAHRLAAPLRPVAKLTVSTWPCHQSLQSSNPCREWTTFFITVFCSF